MATQHDGVNPHTAADLLRQAMHKKSDEDAPDHVGSQSATPSGIATPRPDPSDKRLPGIVSYFGQVGSPSIKVLARSVSATLFAPDIRIMPQQEEGKEREAQATVMRRKPRSGTEPLTAPCSPKQGLQARPGQCRQQQLADDLSVLRLDGAPRCNNVNGYLTPPESSASSFTRKQSEGGDDDSSSGSREKGPGARFAGAPPGGREPTVAGEMGPPPTTRRHTAGIKSLSSIVTESTVHAAHISNPTVMHPSTTPSTPTRARSKSRVSALSSLTASLELAKLTKGVAATSRKKSTPPHTPRALSRSNGTEPARKSPVHVTSNAAQSPAASANGNGDGTTPPELSAPKGKLYVTITEARDLRPSYDPYVVCVFEWNEYISRGPKMEESSEPEDKGLKTTREEMFGGLPIKRSVSDMGRSITIPMKSRQGSTTSLSDQKNFKAGRQVTNPKWDHEAIFDVLGKKSDIDFYVYDRSNQEAFLGHVRMSPNVVDDTKIEGWYKLESREGEQEKVSGEIFLQMRFQKTDKKHYGPEDFQILKLIGKGTFGQVYQVRKKDTGRIYAMKVLSKKVIVQKKEVAHTLGERNILVRTAMADSPFIVGLKFSFQTPTDLYLVTDFMSGGELFWHLQKEGRFNEARAKFYIAELILALQHLHQYDIVYRDLKPENILLDANGHIALCDFGLSKANLTKDATTNTFCGTTEYLAPEVLLDEQGYTTMVDFWSLGVLVFEMCCGWSPFYAEDTQQMYKNIAFGKVRFPRDALSTEGRNFVKGLLNRNPKHRLGATNDAEELKNHPFFADVDWEALSKKLVVPPFKPKLKSNLDTSNFDPEFTNALNTSQSLNARAAALATGNMPASTPLSPGMQANFKGFTFVDESSIEEHFKNTDNGENESMEEDMRDDDGWEQPYDARKREDRMSGVIKTSSADDGIFHAGQFDD